MYSLGSGRLAKLLEMKMPFALLRHVVLATRDTQFRKLKDNEMITLLGSPDDHVRKAVAVKCVKTFGQRRVANLLRSYLAGAGTSYYYNVVHWLDMGVSLQRREARNAASRVLAREGSN
jgi:hypothetical protein